VTLTLGLRMRNNVPGVKDGDFSLSPEYKNPKLNPNLKIQALNSS
jgi:hypothetical protein